MRMRDFKKSIFKDILQEMPDVEYMTTKQLLKLMSDKNYIWSPSKLDGFTVYHDSDGNPCALTEDNNALIYKKLISHDYESQENMWTYAIKRAKESYHFSTTSGNEMVNFIMEMMSIFTITRNQSIKNK